MTQLFWLCVSAIVLTFVTFFTLTDVAKAVLANGIWQHRQLDLYTRNINPSLETLIIIGKHESAIAKNSIKLTSWYFGVCMSNWKMCGGAACLCACAASQYLLLVQ